MTGNQAVRSRSRERDSTADVAESSDQRAAPSGARPRTGSTRPDLGLRGRQDDSRNIVKEMQDIMKLQQEQHKEQMEQQMKMMQMMMTGLQQMWSGSPTAVAPTPSAPVAAPGLSTVGTSETPSAPVAVNSAGTSALAGNAPSAPEISRPGEPDSEEWSEDIDSLLEAQKKDIEAKIRKYMQAKKKIETSEKNVEVLTGDVEHVRYPAGLKAFSFIRKDEEADDAWLAAKESPYSVTITFPKAITRRKAIEWACHHYSTWRAQIELEVDKAISANRKKEADQEVFASTCEKLVQELMDTELSSSLGLVQARKLPGESARKLRYKAAYEEAVQQVAVERAKAEKDKQKFQAKKEADDKQQDNQDPANLIFALLQKVKDNDVDMTSHGDDQLKQDCQKLAGLLRKNGLSPGPEVGQGQNQWWAPSEGSQNQSSKPKGKERGALTRSASLKPMRRKDWTSEDWGTGRTSGKQDRQNWQEGWQGQKNGGWRKGR